MGTLAAAVLLIGCGKVGSELPDGGADLAAPGLAKGQACTMAGECLSGSCVDGVCCESACGGACEACNVPGQEGSCAAVPADTDPQMECLGMAAMTNQDPDAGTGVNLPDGGVMTMATVCAGRCDGNRACKFPGMSTSCGTGFCNSEAEAGRFGCDGTGGCEFGLQACVAYSCGPEACKSSCVSHSDCLDTHYCDGTSGTCKPRKGQNVSCVLNDECTSGFCAGQNDVPAAPKVCCDSSCNFASGDCTAAGYGGICKCAIGGKACDGTCALYYLDRDGDGFGDKADLSPIVGCDLDAPAGRVTDNTDCYDAVVTGPIHADKAYPGARRAADVGVWYTVHRGDGSFDYNCNGSESKQYPEFVGSSCKVCEDPGPWLVGCNTVTCSGKATTTPTRLSCSAKLAFGCASGTTNQLGYTSTVACGISGTMHSCSTCAGEASGYPKSVTQGCL